MYLLGRQALERTADGVCVWTRHAHLPRTYKSYQKTSHRLSRISEPLGILYKELFRPLCLSSFIRFFVYFLSYPSADKRACLYTAAPDEHFEKLTTTGPYAGVLEAFTTGVKLATRYGHLWNYTVHNVTHLWAGDSGRVVDTARHFSAGFFGLDSPAAKVIAISEAADRGGDTLTPG